MGCAHREKRDCGHPALWQQAYIGILPDVASGCCVQPRLSLRAFPVGIARQRDRMRTLRATCIVTGPVIWHSMTIRHMHAAISVRNPQAPRPRSRSAMQQANTLRRSEITNFRVSSALGCLAHAMEARLRQDFTRGDRCPRLHAPSNGFHFEETEGNWVLVFLFFRPRVRGSQGTNRIDLRHHRQTRFGYARSKRSQPQFKAHNSVRPFENGLSLGGSSATRPSG